jgi:hypothetical protein
LDCTNRYYLGILCMPSVAHGLSIVNAKSVTQKTIPGDALFFYTFGYDNYYQS